MTTRDSDESSQDLGAKLRPIRWNPVAFWFLSVASVMIGLLVHVQLGNAPNLQSFVMVVKGLAIVGVVSACLFGFNQVGFYERGLTRKQGILPTTVIRYDEIVQVGLVDHMNERYLYRSILTGSNGASIPIPEFPDEVARLLVSIVELVVLPKLATRMIARMQTGESIHFGKLNITWHGLQWQQLPRVAWEDVSYHDFYLQDLRIFVRQRPLETIKISERTANIVMLLHLIDRMPQQRMAHPIATEIPSTDPIHDSSQSKPQVKGYPQHDPEWGEVQYGLPKTRRFEWMLLVGLMILVIGIAIMAYLPPAIAPRFYGIVPVGLGGILVMISPFFRIASVAVYDQGLVSGDKRMRWDEIEQIYHVVIDSEVQHVPTRTTRMKLVAKDIIIGITGDGLGIESICQAIVIHACDVIVPNLTATLQAGGRFQVGPLHIADGWMFDRNFKMPLEQIQSVYLEGDSLWIRHRSQREPVFRVRGMEWNFPILCRIMKQLGYLA